MRSSFTRSKLPLILWAAILLAAVVTTASHLTGSKDWVHSNVFELLPEADYDPLHESATRTVDAELGTRLLFFVGHRNREVAKQAAATFGELLSDMPLVESVTTRIDESRYSAAGEFYYRYRSRILSDSQLAKLANAPGTVEQEALAQLLAPFGAGSGSLATDPFFLFPASLEALQPPGNALRLDDGFLWARQQDRSYVFVMARVTSPTLSIAEQQSLSLEINEAIGTLSLAHADLDVLKTGFAFYADEATQAAKGEVSTIGVGSLIGLLLLVISTFRSLRPLSLIIVSILAGCMIALAVTLSVFGFVHLFTLVFGASLIGVSVDYAFHFIADDAFGGDDWTPEQGLQNIFAGVTLGLATSVLAYLALTVAPFPGLQQLAVFSSAGLLGAYLTLLAVTRLMRRRYVMQSDSIILRSSNLVLQTWQAMPAPRRAVVIALLVVAIVVGGRQLNIDDDVRMLQDQPAALVTQEHEIQEMLGIAAGGTFLLVSAPDGQALLREEETIRVRLDNMISEGTLDSYQAVSRWVPSLRRQAQSEAAYLRFLQARLVPYLESIGMAPDIAQQIYAGLSAGTPPFGLDDWLRSPASVELRHLLLDTGDDSAASIILLFGIDDVGALADFTVINKGSELSALFGEYRSRVILMLFIAYGLILAGLSIRYGLRRATLLVAPPVLAGAAALVLVSLAGGTLNLFSFLALILVLGIGIDFTLFIAEARHELTSTMFAITLSALTTMLSFGLLSLSGTYAVHSFGLTVLTGIAGAYLLSPVAIAARRAG